MNFQSAGEDPRNYKISTLSTLLIYYKFKETSLWNSIVEFIGQHDVRCSSLYIFQTILGKKKSQLPYYIILLIFVCSFTIYAAITSILIGNTSTLAVYLRLTLSSLLCFCLSFLYSANLRTKILISISTTILCSIFEAFSYYIITSIYSYRVEKILWIFSILQYIAYGEYVFPYFSILIHLSGKGGFCSFFKLYNNFIGYSGTFYVPVTIKTNFISKYKYSVCLFI